MKNSIKKILVYLLVCSQLFNPTIVFALNKDESVYVKLDSDGKVNEVKVSEHLSNYSGSKFTDKTGLNNIKNVNGNEKFSIKDNNITWETNGNDIYYQGTYDKELPIDVKVSYYLNGEKRNVNDMLNQKGKVKIVIEYENKKYEKVNINGKMEKIYVPYAIITTSMLNNNDNKNIKVTNGKIIDNGVTSIITAVSSPGLYESLKVNDLKDLDKVEITYETNSFSLNSIYAVATTTVFDDTDLNNFGNINNIYNNVNLLQKNMDTLVSASKKLNTGSKKISTGLNELNAKTQELLGKYQYYRNQDSNTLKEELIKIVENNINKITPELENEITDAASKLIKENIKDLESSVIAYTLENTKKVVNGNINEIINSIDVTGIVNNVIKSDLYNLLTSDQEIQALTNLLKSEINGALKEIINSKVKKMTDGISASLNTPIPDAYYEALATQYGVTFEQAKAIAGTAQLDMANNIKKTLSNINVADEIINELNNKEYLSNLVKTYSTKINEHLKIAIGSDEKINAMIKDIKEKVMTAIKSDLSKDNIYLNDEVKKLISDTVNQIINDTTKDLAKKYTEDYTNKVVKNVINKEFSEANVDSKLKEILLIHEGDISDKLYILDTTVNTLSDAINQLNNGSKELSNGMDLLSNGLDKYNNEGIKKISKLVNGDVKSFQKRFEAAKKLSSKYKTLDSIDKNTKGTSKIIFMIDSLSKPTEFKNYIHD